MQTYNKSIKSDNLQLIYKIIHTTYKKSIKTYNPLQEVYNPSLQVVYPPMILVMVMVIMMVMMVMACMQGAAREVCILPKKAGEAGALALLWKKGRDLPENVYFYILMLHF